MTRQQLLLRLTLSLFFFSTQITQTIAQEHILMPKFGVVERNDNTNHLVDTTNFDIDDDAVASFGFTYLYKIDNGLAFGVDIFGYENEIISTASNNGDATTGHLYGVVEKIFHTGSAFNPYVGIGLGMVSVSFDADINGDIGDDHEDQATGLSYEIFLGSEFKISEDLGLVIEYKYFDFEVDDDIDDRNIEIDSDGHAMFVGVSLHL